MAPPLPLSESSSRESCPVDHHEPFFNSIGQKQTFPRVRPMSALPPKADMCSALADVRFVPIADIARSFDHFVGAGEQCRGNRYPERPRCTHIDD
jgi:hypothetical protein